MLIYSSYRYKLNNFNIYRYRYHCKINYEWYQVMTSQRAVPVRYHLTKTNQFNEQSSNQTLKSTLSI